MEESPCSQGLELSNIPRSTAFSSAFDARQKRPSGNYASLIDLTLLEEGVSFEKSQSKRYRKNLTRFKNRFNSMGTLSFRRVTEPCEINATASLMLEWKKLWFEEKGIPGESAESLQLENLFTKLLKSQSNAFCFVLELDGKPIAAEIGFAEKSHYYAYYGAFDNEHGAYSPGNVLLVEQLEGTSIYHLFSARIDENCRE